MKTTFKLAATAAVLVLAAGVAMAQPPQGAPAAGRGAAPAGAGRGPAAPPATAPAAFPGWTVIGNGKWTMEAGGEILGVGGSAGGYLATNDSYKDFNIKMEFQVSNPGNSGIYFRCENMAAMADTSCYEANIYDDRPDQDGRTGSLVHAQAPLVKINAQDGKWHTYDVTAQGDHFVILLDGQKTVDVHDSTHAKASPLAIQNAAGEQSTVRIRNVQIKAL